MFLDHDVEKNHYMLNGPLTGQGYDWWWHSFTGVSEKTGKEKSFFVEYFLCNPDSGEDKPVLGQLPENRAKGKRPSYLMVKAGAWGEDAVQLHRFYGWKEIKVTDYQPYRIEADGCFASDTAILGSVKVTPEEAAEHPEYMCGSGSMQWDLTVNKVIPFNVGYGTSMIPRDLAAFEMYWHVEGMKTNYKGQVRFNGETYNVSPETCCGYADKNWGSNFTTPWIWLSSCDLYSRQTGKKMENSAFDIGGGKPRVFGVAIPKQLLGALCLDGKGYEFNFSKFWTQTRTRFKCAETEDAIIWRVKQENLTHIMYTEIKCLKKDMLLINYEAPDGTKRHNRLWNGGTGEGRIKLYVKKEGARMLIADLVAKHVGCEFGEFDK